MSIPRMILACCLTCLVCPARTSLAESAESLQFSESNVCCELPDPCGDACASGCGAVRESLCDNISLFLGLDGSKQPQDLGINAHFGGRAAINGGFPLVAPIGLGLQIGTSLNYADSAVMVMEVVEGTKERTQSFTTVGLFQRLDCGLKWGLTYDSLSEHYFDSISLSQWRVRIGYDIGCRDEWGLWGAVGNRGDAGTFGTTRIEFDVIGQGNLYWRHTWDNQAQTTFWAGVAEGHSETVIVLPEDSDRTGPRLAFGAALLVPMNDHVALFGEANFISPSDTGTVDAYLGFAVYPAGTARRATTNRFAPLFAVANNPTFSVDARR